MVDRLEHALSFGPAARTYERGRPGYPDAALDWLLPPGQPRVLDLGAGTGKLTRSLTGRGLPVTAVDPSDGMLDELHRVLPAVSARRGTAESIPLPDNSVDVVLVAQAWHWADPGRAVPEIARVLSPGGRLGLLWNVRDETAAPWVHRLGQIIGDAKTGRDPVIGPPFGPVDSAGFGWTDTVSPDGLLDLVASRSSVILLPGAERAAVLAQVRQLAATHPSLVGRTGFDLPYVTECHRADLSA